MSSPPVYSLDFSQITLKSLPLVGGKDASLGELFNALKSTMRSDVAWKGWRDHEGTNKAWPHLRRRDWPALQLVHHRAFDHAVVGRTFPRA
jgi:hypothetical protein